MKAIIKAEQGKKAPTRKRIILYMLALIFVGSAIYIFLPRIATLENSIAVLRSMSLWIVCLAIIAEICSYFGSGYILKIIMDSEKTGFSILRAVLITLAASSIGLVMGGWVSYAATTNYWISKSEDTGEASALTGFLPTVYDTVVLIILTGIGLIYLLLIHNLTSAQAVLYIAIFIIWILGIVVAIFGIRSRKSVERPILWVVNLFTRLFKRPDKTNAVHNKITSIYSGLTLLKEKSWIKPILGSCLNIAFDMLSLYLIFVAAGNPVNLMVLIAGYSIAYILKFVSFFVPGGIGVFEAGMTAIYTSLGVPASVSVVVVLSYRLFSFWLPSILGFAATGYLSKTARKNEK